MIRIYLKKIINFIRNLLLYQKFILVLLIYYIVAGVLLYFFEKDINNYINNLFDAYWLLIVFYLSGLENYGPVTIFGKFLALSMFVLGLTTVALIIGKVTSLLVLKAQGGIKMPDNVSEHIAICNWSEKGDKIIKELHHPEAVPETEIIVITDKRPDELKLRIYKEYEKVYFIEGDPTLHDTLRAARVHLAKSVIILADNTYPDPDAKTALIALAISKLERDLPRKPHIIAEIVNHRKIAHLIDAGVDEYICATDYGLGVIAQSAIYQKMTEVYQKLLSYSEDSSEIYFVPRERYSSNFIGKTFIEISDILNKKRDPDNPVILLGVKRKDKVILNPRKDEFDFLKEDDLLIVMAFWQPDLRNY